MNNFNLKTKFKSFPLYIQFTLIVAAITGSLSMTAIFISHSMVFEALHEAQVQKGLTLARHLAHGSLKRYQASTPEGFRRIFIDTLNNEPDIEYIYLVDAKRNVIAHSFSHEEFPEDILSFNLPSSELPYTIQRLSKSKFPYPIHDIAIPFQEGKTLEIHVGLNDQKIHQILDRIEYSIAGTSVVIFLLGLFITHFFTRRLVQPLSELSTAAEKFAQNRETEALDVYSEDEIGNLTGHFNRMMKNILESRQEQLQIKQELMQGQKDWENTFNAIEDIITIQTPDMKIIRANKSYYKSAERTEETNQILTCHQLYHGIDSPCPNCPVLNATTKLQPYTHEVYHEKIGKVFLISAFPVFDENNKLSHIVHIAKDITSFKQSEERRRLLETAIDQAHETVLITDTEGVIQYVNPAFEKRTGYTREEAIGQKPSILKSGKHPDLFYKEIWNALEKGKEWQGQIHNKDKSGNLFKELATISPVVNQSGEITHYVAVKYDITRESELEHQLGQAVKMEAIGTLAGGIAHDFNNILMGITGYTDLAMASLPEDSEAIEDLTQVSIAARRATDLVKQILTFSRQEESGYFKPVKVQLILDEVLKLIRPSFPSSIKIIEDIDKGCPPVNADNTQLHQVIMNLCTNARQAMGAEAGELRIGLKLDDSWKPLHKKNTTPGDNTRYLRLEITDTGCGMDEETLSKIFDPFFTTKEKGKGTGLGMSVVHGIVKQHKGEIEVLSEPGKGSTFYIYLPSFELLTEQKETREKNTLEGTEHILCVDDEVFITDIFYQYLTKYGYKVSRFEDPVEALNFFTAHSADIDLLVTDMTMPDMDGISLTRHIKKIEPDLPVILCTGFSERINASNMTEHGVNAFVYKPVDIIQLCQSIRELLDVS